MRNNILGTAIVLGGLVLFRLLLPPLMLGPWLSYATWIGEKFKGTGMPSEWVFILAVVLPFFLLVFVFAWSMMSVYEYFEDKSK